MSTNESTPTRGEARHTMFMLGVAIGIPAAIIWGIITHQTTWGLLGGPVVGAGLGLILSLIGSKQAE